jgi:hypothetical protein
LDRGALHVRNMPRIQSLTPLVARYSHWRKGIDLAPSRRAFGWGEPNERAERSERNVSIDNIARIAKGLKVEAWRLLRDDYSAGVYQAARPGERPSPSWLVAGDSRRGPKGRRIQLVICSVYFFLPQLIPGPHCQQIQILRGLCWHRISGRVARLACGPMFLFRVLR